MKKIIFLLLFIPLLGIGQTTRTYEGNRNYTGACNFTGTLQRNTVDIVNHSYTISVQALTSSPTDGQTVYFGMLPKAPITTANVSKVYIRKAAMIKIAEIYVYSGTAGTAENWSLYIRVNNATDYLIQTKAVNTNERVFTNTSLSITMAAGDYFEIKGIQPTWSTNPATTIYGGYVYLELK